MTRKDFRKFAEMIVLLENEVKVSNFITPTLVEREIIDILYRDNYRFDRDKWELHKEKVRSNN